MRYYQVKKEFDNAQIFSGRVCGPKKLLRTLVGGELFTPAEYNRIKEQYVYARNFEKAGTKYYTNIDDLFDVKLYNRNRTLFFFGARFYFGKEGDELKGEIPLRILSKEYLC